MKFKHLSEITEKLKYSFPAQLPISAKVEEIKKLWQNNQVIILGGATGSGKTTQSDLLFEKSGRFLYQTTGVS